MEVRKFEHNFEDWPNLTESQMQKYYFQSPIRQITNSFVGTVTRVKDGDTIEVEHEYRDEPVTVRLAEVDTPEKNTREGIRMMQWLKARLEGREARIIINSKNRIGKWNRLIGKVIESGLNVNDEIKMRTKSQIMLR